MRNVRSARVLGPTVILLSLLGCSEPEPMLDLPVSEPEGVVRLSEAQVRAAGIATARLETQSLRQSLRVPGSVGPPDTAQAVIGSIVEGRVARVHVLPGDRVRRGQVLVELHSHELSDAQQQLSAAKAEMSYNQNALGRAEQLFEAGAISRQELERREADFESARAEEERAIEMVEHLYPTPAGNVSAVAPRAGIVFTVHARPGQVALPGTPLVEMGSTSVLWITAFVPEGNSAALAPGDRVTVGFNSPPGASGTARLVRMGEYVDPTNRSVELRFELDSIPEGVRPGAFATVEIPSAAAFDGYELGQDAAVRMGEEDVVFVVEGPGLYRAVPVQVRPARDGTVAVQGIPESAEIVISGAYFLKSAMEVGGGEEGEL